MTRPIQLLALTLYLALGAGCAFRPIFHPPTNSDTDGGDFTRSDAAAALDAVARDAGSIPGDFCEIPLADGGRAIVSRESGLCLSGVADASAPDAPRVADGGKADAAADATVVDAPADAEDADASDAGPFVPDAAPADSETPDAADSDAEIADGDIPDDLGPADAGAADASAD